MAEGTAPADLPFDAGNPFAPDGPVSMVTAILPALPGESQKMAVTFRIPGSTLTVLLDKRRGEQVAASIAETAGLLAEPVPAQANGSGHAHGHAHG